MLKAQTILCIALAVLLLKGNATSAVPAAAAESSPPAPAEALALDGFAGYFPSLKDIQQGIHQLITKRRAALKENYRNAVTFVKNARNRLDEELASWQETEQIKILVDFKPMLDAYINTKNKNPGKNFAKCDVSLDNIVNFTNVIGNDFYLCHYYYNETVTNFGRRLLTNRNAERDALKNLNHFDCKVAEAKDTKSMGEAWNCLINILIQYNNRPNADIAFDAIIESVNAMITDKRRYLNSCPAYTNWYLYVTWKPIWIQSLKRCLSNALNSPNTA